MSFRTTAHTHPSAAAAPRNLWSSDSLALMFAVALLIRLVVAGFLFRELLDPHRDYWHFGWETGRIAHSIAAGKGFASPVYGVEGPTAWMAPAYPYLLAGVFKVFGIFSAASAMVILALNGVFSAATCLPVFFMARKSFGATVARWAGWMWAFYPYAIYFAAGRVWEICLTTLLFSVLFLMTLHLEPDTRLRTWLLYGGVWGLTALTNPATLAALPFLMAWVGFRFRKQEQLGRFLRLSAAAAMVFAVVVGPWFIRNYRTFGRVIPFRDNFWFELYVGNTGDTSDIHPDWAHPSTGRGEMERLRSLGELSYIAEKRAMALSWIRRYPGLFLWITVRRFGFTWSGFWSFSPEYLSGEPFEIPNIFFCTVITLLMLQGAWLAWRNRPGELVPYALCLFSFPLVYYFTHPLIDYRQPIDPLIVILAVYGMVCRSRIPAATTGQAPPHPVA